MGKEIGRLGERLGERKKRTAGMERRIWKRGREGENKKEKERERERKRERERERERERVRYGERGRVKEIRIERERVESAREMRERERGERERDKGRERVKERVKGRERTLLGLYAWKMTNIRTKYVVLTGVCMYGPKRMDNGDCGEGCSIPQKSHNKNILVHGACKETRNPTFY